MDNLVLIRVAVALHASLARTVLRDVKEESSHRSRWVFESPEGYRSVLISLRPELPWIGRPTGRPLSDGRGSTALGGLARKLLRGSVLKTVSKPTADRIVRFDFAEGHALVAELATHGANLILLDERGRVLATAKRARSSQARLANGVVYSPPPIPSRLAVPFELEPDEIDERLARLEREGEGNFEALRRHFFGVGSAGARLVVGEARSTQRSAGAVLKERLRRLDRAEDDPVIDCELDPLRAAERGELIPERMALLPWPPPAEVPLSYRAIQLDDAAATAGLYHEAIERLEALDLRSRGLRSLLDRERERLRSAEEKAERDLESFEDPERFRRWGESLLAGLGQARRSGDRVWVPDPYAASGAEIPVPVPAGARLEEAAAEHFRQHRRARRGLERAAERRRALGERRQRLDRLAARFEDPRGLAAVEEFEAAMRSERIPVGLHATRRAREKASVGRPRLEGVRVFRTVDGMTLLVGRGARQNHRLTFKLASPDDFWFHAEGCRGAHVILRNEERLAAPPVPSLRQAAAAAAWYSEAREQDRVDVQWTRRKNVRKPRKAPIGTVVIKRFNTERVRPEVPPDP